jgi:hypothetical protein
MEILSPNPEHTAKALAVLDQKDISRAGAVRGVVLDRNETSIPVHLSELGTISTANSKATFWWSITTLGVGSGLSLYLSGLSITAPTAWQIALTQFGPIGAGVFTVASLIAAIRETTHRRSEIYKLYRECGVEAPTIPVRIRQWWKGNV